MTFWNQVVERRGYYLASLVVLTVDQVTKIAAHAWLRGHGPVEVVPNLFNLWYSRNPGGLFGYFGSLGAPWRTILLTAFPLLAVVVIGVFLAKTDEPDRSTKFGLALILGGAVGNLIDRVFRGEVVDFLDVYASNERAAAWLVERFGTAHWPTFNVADSAIVVGAFLLVLDILRPDRTADGVPEA
jgi:signal peptidase II